MPSRLARRLAIGGAAAVAVVGGGSAVAVATGSATTPVYQACLSAHGSVYGVVQDSPTRPSCNHGDTAITWNQTGPAGPQGDKGDQGDPGAPGTSAYQIWLDQGHTGTEADFLASLEGAQGPKGDIGPQGRPGTVGAVTRSLKTQQVQPGGIAFVSVYCDSGETATGGGFSAPDGATVTVSAPDIDGASGRPDGWTLASRFDNPPAGATAQTFAVYVLCAG